MLVVMFKEFFKNTLFMVVFEDNISVPLERQCPQYSTKIHLILISTILRKVPNKNSIYHIIFNMPCKRHLSKPGF